MSGSLVLASGLATCLGVLLVVLGLQPTASGSTRRSGSPKALRTRWKELGRRWQTLVAVALVAGVIVFAVTGWVVLLVLVPALILGLPWLLSSPPQHDIALLQALDQWVRLLASSISTGKSVPDAIRATRKQAPAVISDAVQLAVSRMDARWSSTDALRGLADDLDSPDADAVVAALILASQRGGVGASDSLKGLAESTQDRLRALREVESERAKPRIVVRQVTTITLVVLAVALLLGRGFFAPYGTPLGQVILALLLLLYVGALVVLRLRTTPPRRERILTGVRP